MDQWIHHGLTIAPLSKNWTIFSISIMYDMII